MLIIKDSVMSVAVDLSKELINEAKFRSVAEHRSVPKQIEY